MDPAQSKNVPVLFFVANGDTKNFRALFSGYNLCYQKLLSLMCVVEKPVICIHIMKFEHCFICIDTCRALQDVTAVVFCLNGI